MRTAKALEMQRADRQQVQKLTREGGGRGQCKKASLSPCRLLHPAKNLQDPLTDLASTTRTTFLSAWGTRPYLSSSAKRKRERRASLQERPFRGSIRTQSQIGEGGFSEGGASPLQGLHHSKDGIPGAMELKFAPSPTLPPSYLFVSSSSSSSGSVAAITTSHSAAAAILPPGPESRVGGRR